MQPLNFPPTDPTPIFEYFRANLGTELLTAAVSEFHLFEHLADSPKSFDELAKILAIAERSAQVLFTAMRAMKLIEQQADGKLTLTDLGRNHLLPDSEYDVSGYVGLTASAAGVRAIVDRLRYNAPAAIREKGGAAFIFKAGMESAMDHEASARRLTLALAGRARNVAPYLAANVPFAGVNTLLDVAGGTGIYAIACLRQYPAMKAIVLDRPEVLRVAKEFGERYQVSERLTLLEGDMFNADYPKADAVLLSNVLHDWDYAECHTLLQKASTALPSGGRVLIHDAFLDDDLGGPLAVAVYSAALFSLTEGRAYSAGEFRKMLRENHFHDEPTIWPTLVHCGVLAGYKR